MVAHERSGMRTCERELRSDLDWRKKSSGKTACRQERPAMPPGALSAMRP